MKRFLYELSESWKIAAAQMRSNKTRSTLTALGVIIGIVAVTLMGTAIGGIQIGFDKSMAVFGDDVLYVSQWPWKRVDDWWNYRDRKKIKTEYAEPINRMIAATPNSNLVIAVPTSSLLRSVKNGQSEVSNVLIRGTVSDYLITSTFDFKEGRFFNEVESRGGANVCVIGYDVADALFPSESPIDKSVLINGQPFRVVGVISRQGTFLGLFSLDSIVVMPLPAFQKYFSAKSESDILRKSEGQNETRRSERRADRLHAACARIAAGEKRRLQHQRTTGVQKHARSDQELHRHRRAFYYRPFAFCRRNRDNEYHVRERERAHERNRNAQSSGRAATHDPSSIPDRIDFAVSARRIHRIGLCLRNVHRHRAGVSLFSDSFFARPRPREHGRLDSDRACSPVSRPLGQPRASIR